MVCPGYKARIESECRRRNVDILRFFLLSIPPRSAFAADSDTILLQTIPGAPCASPRVRPSAPA